MDAIEAIKAEVAGSRRAYEGTVSDLTPEMINWIPPGVANHIGAMMLHIALAEDNIVHTRILGKPNIWESGNWSEKLGVPSGVYQSLEGSRSIKFDLAKFQEYADQVMSETDACLDALTSEDLDRLVQARVGERTVASFLLGIVVGHRLMHTGEISTIKGVQGARGYAI